MADVALIMATYRWPPSEFANMTLRAVEDYAEQARQLEGW